MAASKYIYLRCIREMYAQDRGRHELPNRRKAKEMCKVCDMLKTGSNAEDRDSIHFSVNGPSIQLNGNAERVIAILNAMTRLFDAQTRCQASHLQSMEFQAARTDKVTQHIEDFLNNMQKEENPFDTLLGGIMGNNDKLPRY